MSCAVLQGNLCHPVGPHSVVQQGDKDCLEELHKSLRNVLSHAIQKYRVKNEDLIF